MNLKVLTRSYVIAACLLGGLLSCSTVAYSAPITDFEQGWVDGHVHIVDFFQEGESLEKLIASMDKHEIHSAMITGIAVKKKWADSEPERPIYYQSDASPLYWFSATDHLVAKQVERLNAAQRKRLYPFITGFNPTDLDSVSEIKMLLELYPQFWQGIGEVFTRHDDLSMLTEGEVARADHPAMLKIYKLAAKHDLPVLLHSNVSSKRDKESLYLPELKAALKAAPKTRFIWAHAGASGTLHRWQKHDDLHKLLERLLKRYPNLSIDLSWCVLEPYILKKGKPKQVWLDLINTFPDRFVLGSDVVGKYDNQGNILKEFEPLLDALDAPARQGLKHRNFRRLLPKWSPGYLKN